LTGEVAARRRVPGIIGRITRRRPACPTWCEASRAPRISLVSSLKSTETNLGLKTTFEFGSALAWDAMPKNWDATLPKLERGCARSSRFARARPGPRQRLASALLAPLMAASEGAREPILTAQISRSHDTVLDSYPPETHDFRTVAADFEQRRRGGIGSDARSVLIRIPQEKRGEVGPFFESRTKHRLSDGGTPHTYFPGFRWTRLRSLTPAPPPFSSMNSMPAASSAA
jgi:hypothetical protein